MSSTNSYICADFRIKYPFDSTPQTTYCLCYMLLAVVLSLGILATTDAGCTQMPYSCGTNAGSCATPEEAQKSIEFCMGKSCGGCGGPKLQDTCYTKYGHCKKTADSCGWEQTSQLNSCIKDADAKEAACFKAHNHNGGMGDDYFDCVKEAERTLK